MRNEDPGEQQQKASSNVDIAGADILMLAFFFCMQGHRTGQQKLTLSSYPIYHVWIPKESSEKWNYLTPKILQCHSGQRNVPLHGCSKNCEAHPFLQHTIWFVPGYRWVISLFVFPESHLNSVGSLVITCMKIMRRILEDSNLGRFLSFDLWKKEGF